MRLRGRVPNRSERLGEINGEVLKRGKTERQRQNNELFGYRIVDHCLSISRVLEYKILLSKMSYLTSTKDFTPEVTRVKKPLGELLLSLQERIDIAKVVYTRPNEEIRMSYVGQMVDVGSTSVKGTPKPEVTAVPPISREDQPIFVARRNALSQSGLLSSSRGPEAARAITRGRAAVIAAPTHERGTSRIGARVHFSPPSSSSSSDTRK